MAFAIVVSASAELLAEAGIGTLASSAPPIKRTTIGQTPDGTTVEQFTLTNRQGLEVNVLTYGAMITSVKAPDRKGRFDSVTLHFDPPAKYLTKRSVMGAIVGRFANRIAGAAFTLDGVEYRLNANMGAHQIHGGRNGFHTVIWEGTPFEEKELRGVRLVHISPDGDEGFPGRLEVTVSYSLTDDNRLKMEYLARTDKPTHVNLTNHAYWNLAGASAESIWDQELFVNADRFLTATEDKFPTGEIRAVRDSPMDFTQPKKIGQDVEASQYGFYDHCYVLNQQEPGAMTLAARAIDRQSGRVMDVHTTQPGVQLYTGNPRAFCLETQHYPNTPNEPRFPSTVLRPGEEYHETTIHTFSVLP